MPGGKLTLTLRCFSTQPAPFQIAETSDVGQPGADVHLDCVVTLMTPDGRTLECLLLAEVIENALAAIHVLPLADLAPKVNYAIVGIDREAARERLASLASVSFTKVGGDPGSVTLDAIKVRTLE